jgi:hypothetical protein
MQHAEIADLIGVPLGDLEDLLNGRCSFRLAQKLRIDTPATVEDFIAGAASVGMQKRLNVNAG